MILEGFSNLQDSVIPSLSLKDTQSREGLHSLFSFNIIFSAEGNKPWCGMSISGEKRPPFVCRGLEQGGGTGEETPVPVKCSRLRAPKAA